MPLSAVSTVPFPFLPPLTCDYLIYISKSQLERRLSCAWKYSEQCLHSSLDKAELAELESPLEAEFLLSAELKYEAFQIGRV